MAINQNTHHAFNRDRLFSSFMARLESTKQDDGSFKVNLAGNEKITVSGKTEGEAVRAMEQELRNRMMKGDWQDLNSPM